MSEPMSREEERRELLAQRALADSLLRNVQARLAEIEREEDRETRVRWLDGQRRVIERDYPQDAHP
jgi:hypothetical protein